MPEGDDTSAGSSRRRGRRSRKHTSADDKEDCEEGAPCAIDNEASGLVHSEPERLGVGVTQA
jgi:hypothetical protein